MDHRRESPTFVTGAITFISERFDVAVADDVDTDADSRLEALRRALALRLATMLEREMARLPELLYRIDLDEERVRTVMTTSPLDRIAFDLADLVIERTLEKVETRERYRRERDGR